MRGFDTDNDSVFVNETVRDHRVREGIERTGCRPYRKNDQAHAEQKNGAIVRASETGETELLHIMAGVGPGQASVH